MCFQQNVFSTKCFFQQENDAVFVMTNMIITPRQKQDKCPEDGQYVQARCHNDSDCVAGQEVVTGHGQLGQFQDFLFNEEYIQYNHVLSSLSRHCKKNETKKIIT